jgi:ABC-type phosphate transport system substrate-binding protein
MKLLLFLGLFLFLPVKAAQSQSPKVQVIVNSSVAKSQVSVEQIRRIFSMRQTAWADKQSITVFVLVNKHKTHQTFSTKILGLFPYQLERVWNKLVYSGLGEEPIKVNSEQEMLDRVNNQPGSIGYVMNKTEFDNVKVINVIRK